MPRFTGRSTLRRVRRSSSRALTRTGSAILHSFSVTGGKRISPAGSTIPACNLDPGDRRSEPYLILEFVEGENLRGVLRRRGQLSIDEAADWATQLATTLQYLHGLGIVHKPLTAYE